MKGFFVRYTWSVVDANAYFIKSGRKGLLVDAVCSGELYERLSEVDELSVILTHCHFDHICGLNRIRELVPASTMYATELCSENIGNPYRNLSSAANAFLVFYNHDAEQGDVITPFTCKPADVVFTDWMDFVWEGHRIRLESFQGHSKDGLVCTLDDRYVFTGDTLLPVPTATRLPGGSTEKFWGEDVPRFERMGDVWVFPGHGEPGEIKGMLAGNREAEK